MDADATADEAKTAAFALGAVKEAGIPGQWCGEGATIGEDDFEGVVGDSHRSGEGLAFSEQRM